MQLWYQLSKQEHPNVLPFYGDYEESPKDESKPPVSKTVQPSGMKIYLVSPWASEGSIEDYFAESDDNQDNRKQHQHAKKLVGTSMLTIPFIDCLIQVGDVVVGLEFLHSGVEDPVHSSTEIHNKFDSLALEKRRIWHGDLHPVRHRSPR
jgi:hypothetical protein